MNKIINTFKKEIIFFLSLIIILTLYINIKLHTGPDLCNYENTKNDVVTQLNFIGNQLKNNQLGEKMQAIFPEGYMFVYSLYGLTWAEIAKHESENTLLYKTALSEARFAFAQTNTKLAKSTFDESLQPKYGIYYRGWNNYLLAKILDASYQKDSIELKLYVNNCDEIVNAFTNSTTPFIESYKNNSWPADAMVAVASLSMYDKQFTPKYTQQIKSWIPKVKANVDKDTKLVPHTTSFPSAKSIQCARGESISLMLILLSEIDKDFAKEQFVLFHEQYTFTRLFLPAIREFPLGKESQGDIDSGPVIFDMSFAGTIVSIGTFKKFNEYGMANRLSSCVEAFGIPYIWNNQKKYVFGKLPIADAFIAWSRIQVGDEELNLDKNSHKYSYGNFYMFHILSILIIVLLVYASLKIIRQYK